MDNFSKYGSKEKYITNKWINQTPWLKQVVLTNEKDNTSLHDRKITLNNGKIVLIEVKEDEIFWFNRTGNIGLDMISSFKFKTAEKSKKWKTEKNCWVPIKEYEDFLKDIEVQKWGKLKTCDAHVQVFFVKGKLLKAYSNKKLQSKDLLNYLKNNYRLRINDKATYNLKDYWESGAFFVNPLTDKKLISCEINSIKDIIE